MRPKRTHAWLFAFTDLAFLLLISLSMIPSAPPDLSLRYAEMSLPEVPDSRNLQPTAERAETWELRVLPFSEEHPAPFRLALAGSREVLELDEATLIPALEELRTRQARPVLLPEKTSFSQDFLFAAGAVARVWQAPESSSIVRPVTAGAAE